MEDKKGRAGGKARAAKMTPQQRSEQAKGAANARWRKSITIELVKPDESIYKIGGKYLLHDHGGGCGAYLEPFEVILMALDIENKYAMVRRPKCIAFVCEVKQLKK